MEVLKTIENNIGLKEHLISQLPELKSFLPSRTTVTEAALLAFTKLATNTGHKSSLHLEFAEILSKYKVSKKFSLLKERRFCLLGYTAAAVLFHLDHFKELLLTTKSNNLLVLACKLYIDCDFILNAFVSLAYFTYRVTFPFFQLSIKGDQKDCIFYLNKMYEDLAKCEISTLDSFLVSIVHTV